MQIHKAAMRGDKEAVLRQLSLGTPVDATDSESWGSTALMLAACSEHADLSMLELLVARGANINAVGCERGETPFSCSAGDIKKMRYLLTLGADPFGGKSASKRMGWATSIEAIRLLLELGFDPTIEDDNGCPSVLSSVAHECDWERLRLFDQFGISMDSLDWTDLMCDIILGSTKAVGDHLKNGAELSGTAIWDRSPFLLSICSGDVSKAQLLLNAGGRLEDRAHCGESALDCAILSQSAEMLTWLLSLGVDANMRGVIDQTPLMTAAEEKNAAAVKILIEHGASVNAAKDSDIQAINFVRDPAVTKLLASAGADVDHIDGTGMFPLKSAVEEGNVELVRCLIELGANVNNKRLGGTALHQAANYDELEIMRILLAAGADPNAAEEDEWRPLWWVKSREAAQVLIDANASLSVRDGFGQTAFEFHKDADAEIRELLQSL